MPLVPPVTRTRTPASPSAEMLGFIYQLSTYKEAP
jgi:hypothetical protein